MNDLARPRPTSPRANCPKTRNDLAHLAPVFRPGEVEVGSVDQETPLDTDLARARSLTASNIIPIDLAARRQHPSNRRPRTDGPDAA